MPLAAAHVSMPATAASAPSVMACSRPEGREVSGGVSGGEWASEEAGELELCRHSAQRAHLGVHAAVVDFQ